MSPGELRPHTVYLVRLESHLGKYPSPDTWFELRYSRFQQLHQRLRETHPALRLPVFPRARPRWFTTHHPSYVLGLSEELRRYYSGGPQVQPTCSRTPNLCAVVLADLGRLAT